MLHSEAEPMPSVAHPFITVSRGVVCGVIPRHGCGPTKEAPVLFLSIGYTDDLSFDAPHPGS